ncbi:MAG TPA: tyrosine-protein phosphatase [Polyangia bacterium]|jgi:protein-tyrosine phosphatase|nr:tyrosine-protein phosphatase [Polyangia bacterium]
MRPRAAWLVAFSLALSATAACGPTQQDAGCGNAEPCARSRPILRGDVVNARDLGGVPLAPSAAVACGAIFRGPPLSALTPPGCADAAGLGLRTILDLRTDGERTSQPDDACVGAQVVAAPLPIPYALDTAAYLADFDSDDSIARVFHTLADDAAYPIYFHCTYGRDRTGVVAAAVLLALGASRADVVTEYSLSASTVGAWPRSLEGLLDEIDARGGIEAALAAKGVTAEDLAALRARVTAR